LDSNGHNAPTAEARGAAAVTIQQQQQQQPRNFSAYPQKTCCRRVLE